MVARDGFVAGKECDKLIAAMKSFWNTDAKAITYCFTGCSNKQRQQIAAHFMQVQQRSLIEDLKKALVGCTERLVFAMMCEPFRFLSIELHDALSGTDVNERVLVEILCTKTSAEIKQIKEAYKLGELKFQSIQSHNN